jgi:hypothetical protein
MKASVGLDREVRTHRISNPRHDCHGCFCSPDAVSGSMIANRTI